MSAPLADEEVCHAGEDDEGDDEPTQIRLSGEEPDLVFAPAERS